MYATFQEALAQAEKEAPGSAALACFASVFAADAIPDEVFRQPAAVYHGPPAPVLPGASAASRALDETLADAVAVDEALSTLHRLSILRFSGPSTSFAMHRLVQAAVRDLMGAELISWLGAAVNVLIRLFPTVVYENFALCERLLPHVRAALSLVRGDELNSAAGILAMFGGQYLERRAQYAESEVLQRRALEMLVAAHGDGSVWAAMGMTSLAIVLRVQRKYDEAETMLRRAMAINKKHFGVENPEDVVLLAGILADRGRLVEAEAMYHQAFATLDSEEANEASRMQLFNDFGLFLSNQERFDEAERYYRNALEISQATIDPNHPTIAAQLLNLAETLSKTNRIEESETLFRRALAIDEHVWGPNHPEVAIDCYNFALVLYKLRRSEEAESLARRALAIDEETFGGKHPRVPEELWLIAFGRLAAEDLAAAGEFARKALAASETVFGTKDEQYAESLQAFASFLFLEGDESGARDALKRAAAILGKTS